MEVLLCGFDIALVESNECELEPWLLPAGVHGRGLLVPSGRGVYIAPGEIDLSKVVEVLARGVGSSRCDSCRRIEVTHRQPRSRDLDLRLLPPVRIFEQLFVRCQRHLVVALASMGVADVQMQVGEAWKNGQEFLIPRNGGVEVLRVERGVRCTEVGFQSVRIKAFQRFGADQELES